MGSSTNPSRPPPALSNSRERSSTVLFRQRPECAHYTWEDAAASGLVFPPLDLLRRPFHNSCLLPFPLFTPQLCLSLSMNLVPGHMLHASSADKRRRFLDHASDSPPLLPVL